MSLQHNYVASSGGKKPLATLDIGECSLRENKGEEGGGIHIADGTVTLKQSIVEDNSATRGGGIYFDGGQVSDYRTRIQQNTASSSGGGIYVGSTQISLNQTEIVANGARYVSFVRWESVFFF